MRRPSARGPGAERAMVALAALGPDQRASDYVATHIGGVEARGHHPLSGSHRFRADAAGLTLRMLGD